MYTKQQQAGRHSRRRLSRVDAPESELQEFTDNYLGVCQVPCIRMPDTMNARVIRRALAGWPDNVCLLPLTRDYAIACLLELKTRTQLHRAQHAIVRELPVRIAQRPEEVQCILDAFREDAERLRRELRE